MLKLTVNKLTSTL